MQNINSYSFDLILSQILWSRYIDILSNSISCYSKNVSILVFLQDWVVQIVVSQCICDSNIGVQFSNKNIFLPIK